jgi:tRNA pseudouridine38-40 synthase
MKNIKLIIAYDGTRYAGWQTQEGRRDERFQSLKVSPQSPFGAAGQARSQGLKIMTVQGEIERALQTVLRHKVSLVGSGRTDAGVHAVGQVANFKTASGIDLSRLLHSLNAVLPRDILVRQAREVPASFHSRFDATRKVYRYVIANQPVRPVFAKDWAYWVRMPLDIPRMARAAKSLLGRKDFSSFQASDRVRRRRVTRLVDIRVRRPRPASVFPFGPMIKAVTVDIEATGFLRGMVRNIVGTLIEVGQGKREVSDLRRILAKKDRRSAGPSAPARGLFLWKVFYD